ncbi:MULTISPECIES: peptidase [unclassified Sutcliffiella]|uniref:peptidase n=1 Tax=unclassified Sutcliffiella TaxID=2837532 RepID=UPI0030CEF291
MSDVFLTNIIVKNNRVDFNYNSKGKISRYFHPENILFYEYNKCMENVPISILAIPFISNIAPLVWITDSNLYLDELDEVFYKSLDEVKKGYQSMFPNIKFKGNIQVKKLVKNEYEINKKSASLFSGGLDALTTYIRNKNSNPILITEYAWHEEKILPSDTWEADKKNALLFGESNNLTNIFVESNYGTFLLSKLVDKDFSKKLGDTWWHGLHHGLAIISAAIPIAYDMRVQTLFIASSNTPAYKVTCASDPTVDNKIKFASGNVFHDGYDLTRQKKLSIVLNNCKNVENIQLRVCFKNEINCCECEKCLRTIMGIIAEGYDPRDFGFNLPNDSVKLSEFLRHAMKNESKFFTDNFIKIYWNEIRSRFEDNHQNIVFKEIGSWMIDYNFKKERFKELLAYRMKYFFPIIRRKISNLYKESFYYQKSR